MQIPITRALRATLLLLAAASVFTAPPAHAAAARRPNFLFVYTDDQRWDALGVVQREQGERARFPWFTTPHMDRLAAEGVRFREAFVTLSLCAPSRAAFLTGRYNHLNGVPDNRTPFPEQSVTHASLMGAAGYATAYIGKWHMGGQRGQRAGFTYSASFIGQGRYDDCPFEINGVSTPTQGWVDDVATDFAIAFMKAHRAAPFSIVLGYKATHGPTTPPERAKNRFAGAEARPVPSLGLPAIYRTGPDSLAAPVKEKAKAKAKAKAAATTAPAGNASPGGLNLNYFRCVSAADDNLGRLLATLDELGLADNTVVVFTSDNGYYLGEHSLGDKRSAYDESLRIPLLVRYPKLFPRGKTVDQMALNVDLAPTFLELAGLPVPAEVQGRSWVPLIAGRAADWRRAFFYEYFREGAFPTTPTVLAVRTETAKLIKYPGYEQWTELFDLKADPYETKNLAREPAAKPLLDAMLAEFTRQQTAVGYREP